MSANAFRAFIAFGLLSLAAPPAWAVIDTPADSPVEARTESPLFLRGAKVQELPPPAVIYYRESYQLQAASPFPGGCFNCPTLPSNSGNSAGMLSRSHSFSQDLFKPGGQRIYVVPQ